MFAACASVPHRRSGTLMRRTAHRCGGRSGIESFAYARPDGPVTVFLAMLQSLSPPQLRALLAHKRAHISHHHHRWRLVVDGDTRVNPLLRPVAQAVYGLTELRADPPRQSWWRVVGRCLIVAATAFATVRAYNSLDLAYDAAQRAAAIYR